MTSTQFLEDMTNHKNMQVYVHCQYGVEECATVLLTYLCLYYQVEVNKGVEYIKKYYPEAEPNVKSVA